MKLIKIFDKIVRIWDQDPDPEPDPYMYFRTGSGYRRPIYYGSTGSGSARLVITTSKEIILKTKKCSIQFNTAQYSIVQYIY
jgi:hypothetical protein